MKNTIAILALIAATATSVSAQNAMNSGGVVGSPTDFTWDGVADLPDRCEFHEGNTNGKMKLQDDELTWVVTEPAQIGLRVRGLSNVWIENDGMFIGSDGKDFPAVVDYEGDPANKVQGVGASYYTYDDNAMKFPIMNTSNDKVTVNVNERDGDMYITLGGAAYAQPGTKFRTGISYTIVHTITCID
jgi:hypothetical protein